jgi:hypothetical protein
MLIDLDLGASYQAGNPRLIAIEVLQVKGTQLCVILLGFHIDVYSICNKKNLSDLESILIKLVKN